MKKFAIAALLTVSGAFVPSAEAAGQTCEELAQLALPNTKVTSAQTVAAGAFAPPSSLAPWLAGDPDFYKRLPAFCRVTAEAKPTADSDIKIEVWMPSSGWNGKFRGQGNGGFAGEIDYRVLALAVSQGYASAATDTGHAANGGDASWALGHPEKIIDFAYRAIHQMTVVGKATVKTFYGDAAQHSYFANCSNGGRQALMEAQRYPEDYDGILAGAPANYWTHLLSSALYDAQTTTLDPASYIPTSKIPAIAKAVNEACDAKDGVTDGILNDPRQCHFDPASLLCKAVATDDPATSASRSRKSPTLKKLYKERTTRRKREIFPGFLPGGEDGEGGWGLGLSVQLPARLSSLCSTTDFSPTWSTTKADWDYKKANLDEAVAAADEKYADVLNATDTNLKPFESHGGKLIIYHGWNDSAISRAEHDQLLRERAK